MTKIPKDSCVNCGIGIKTGWSGVCTNCGRLTYVIDPEYDHEFDLSLKKSLMALLCEFHEAFNYEKTTDPELRKALHEEEHEELMQALDNSASTPSCQTCRAALLKELVDVCYVAIGTAWSLDMDFEGAFREVHRSNMSKLDDDGVPVYRADGKVMKGPNYVPPDLRPYVTQ